MVCLIIAALVLSANSINKCVKLENCTAKSMIKYNPVKSVIENYYNFFHFTKMTQQSLNDLYMFRDEG